MTRGSFLMKLLGGSAAVAAPTAVGIAALVHEDEPEWWTPEGRGPFLGVCPEVVFHNPSEHPNVHLRWDVDGNLWAVKGNERRRLM